ncbi:MAG TPA: hypothetical protein VIL07_11390 [Symbiobacteriaceae bacterium]
MAQPQIGNDLEVRITLRLREPLEVHASPIQYIRRHRKPPGFLAGVALHFNSASNVQESNQPRAIQLSEHHLIGQDDHPGRRRRGRVIINDQRPVSLIGNELNISGPRVERIFDQLHQDLFPLGGEGPELFPQTADIHAQMQRRYHSVAHVSSSFRARKGSGREPDPRSIQAYSPFLKSRSKSITSCRAVLLYGTSRNPGGTVSIIGSS